MTNLPESARFSLWLGAWLQGRASADELRDVVIADDATHDLVIEGEASPLLLGIGILRSRGARSTSLALPVPGDLLGVAGPAPANDAALDAGQGVLLPEAGLLLVPDRIGAGVTWTAHLAHGPAQLPDIFEAATVLRQTVAEAATVLASLDVARWRPELADELADLRRPLAIPVPGDTPDRVVALVGLAARCLRISELALDDDAGISSFEIDQRRAVLVGLNRAARRALVAACSR